MSAADGRREEHIQTLEMFCLIERICLESFISSNLLAKWGKSDYCQVLLLCSFRGDDDDTIECDYISTNSLTRNLIAIPLGYLKVGLCGWEDINFNTAKLRIFSLHTCTLSFSSLLIESIVKYLSDSINLDISSPHSQTGKPRWEMCAHHTALSRLHLCVDTPENQWEMWKMSNKFSISHHKQ